MRVLGFQKHWDKLNLPIFTTFRFEHRGKLRNIGERFQIKIKPRSKGGGEGLGIAEIINKELRKLGTAFSEYQPTEEEAIADGFANLKEMNEWFAGVYGSRVFAEPIYKLTLKWTERG